MDGTRTNRRIKGRGVATRPDGRFQGRSVEFDPALEEDPAPETRFRPMRSRSIISTNDSPDIRFNRSINPYQGCEHGCVYCYARPSHSYLDLSPGIDFESRIFFKPNAVDLLRAEWEKPGYVPEPITIGANTDPYQPGEKSLALTRGLLELFREYRHPVNVITKGTLMRRDLDLLADLAEDGLASVAVSIPTTDNALKRILEPRVPSAGARFAMVREFAAAGVPVSVMMAPVIPAINDAEIETIVEQSAAAGARSAAWILLRLPHELKAMFRAWLVEHFPERAAHVMSLVRQASGGQDYDNRFGVRQTGRGPYAMMLKKRFETACRRHGLNEREHASALQCRDFRRPGDTQMSLLP